MDWGSLSPIARMFLLGVTANDVARAKAIALVLFADRTIRSVADEFGVPKTSLARWAGETRIEMRLAMRRTGVKAEQMVAA